MFICCVWFILCVINILHSTGVNFLDMIIDRQLASVPKIIEVVKISFTQGLVLISIIQLCCKIGCIKSYFVLPLGSWLVWSHKSKHRK